MKWWVVADRTQTRAAGRACLQPAHEAAARQPRHGLVAGAERRQLRGRTARCSTANEACIPCADSVEASAGSWLAGRVDQHADLGPGRRDGRHRAHVHEVRDERIGRAGGERPAADHDGRGGRRRGARGPQPPARERPRAALIGEDQRGRRGAARERHVGLGTVLERPRRAPDRARFSDRATCARPKRSSARFDARTWPTPKP